MRILACDPALSFGWAHSCGESGTIDLRPKKNESAGMSRIKLRGWLRRLYADCPWDLLAYERVVVYPGHGQSVVSSCKLEGVLEEFCLDHEIEYLGVSPGEIKKHATGKGSASKQKMADAFFEKWPDRRAEDDNEVDACWLLDLMQKDYPS